MQQLLTEANSFKFKFIKFELIVLTLQHHLQLSFELLRLAIERIKPMNAESIILNPPLKLENSFELQITFKINIRIFAQPCTWKELTNYTKFERPFKLLWNLKTRYFYTTLVLSVLSRSASVSYAGSSCSDTFVTIFLQVNNL